MGATPIFSTGYSVRGTRCVQCGACHRLLMRSGHVMKGSPRREKCDKMPNLSYCLVKNKKEEERERGEDRHDICTDQCENIVISGGLGG